MNIQITQSNELMSTARRLLRSPPADVPATMALNWSVYYKSNLVTRKFGRQSPPPPPDQKHGEFVILSFLTQEQKLEVGQQPFPHLLMRRDHLERHTKSTRFLFTIYVFKSTDDYRYFQCIFLVNFRFFATLLMYTNVLFAHGKEVCYS